jgi:hypothetical protein
MVDYARLSVIMSRPFAEVNRPLAASVLGCAIFGDRYCDEFRLDLLDWLASGDDQCSVAHDTMASRTESGARKNWGTASSHPGVLHWRPYAT